MNVYFQMLKRPVFAMEDVRLLCGNTHSARSAVGRLVKKGLVAKIRNNLYTCVSGETEAPLANRFQIASAISSSSYVTHHSALEYYGLTDQVIYEVYVGSKTAFRSFEFDGYTYRFVRSKVWDGVEALEFSGGVRVTDRERTMLDCIKDMDKLSGLEEIVACVQGMSRISEERLLHYLARYDNQFLYQKVGYLLSEIRTELELSDHFFSVCRNKMGKSTRYLSSDFSGGKYVGEWKLVVPERVYYRKNEGLTHADVQQGGALAYAASDRDILGKSQRAAPQNCGERSL